MRELLRKRTFHEVLGHAAKSSSSELKTVTRQPAPSPPPMTHYTLHRSQGRPQHAITAGAGVQVAEHHDKHLLENAFLRAGGAQPSASAPFHHPNDEPVVSPPSPPLSSVACNAEACVPPCVGRMQQQAKELLRRLGSVELLPEQQNKQQYPSECILSPAVVKGGNTVAGSNKENKQQVVQTSGINQCCCQTLSPAEPLTRSSFSPDVSQTFTV